MQIYNNDGRSVGRSKSACSYCRNSDHNAPNCPRVAEDYAYFSQTPPVIPMHSTTLKTQRWFGTPKYWGEWYEKCNNIHAKQEIAKEKALTSPTRSARAKSKCGFCGSTDHNRRQCDVMDRYTAGAVEANQNWRRAFYQKFVAELGISEGALLNLKERHNYHGSNDEDKFLIGIVTSVNWEELSLFCSTKEADRYCYRDHQYRQNLIVTVQIGGENRQVQFGENGITNGAGKNLVKYSTNRWNSPEFVSVLSPSETPIGEEWIEEGHAKAMAFLTKKRSAEKLDEAKVTDLIQHWA